MEIAVLVCGMLREFEIASPSWSFRHHDCFLATWDRTEDILPEFPNSEPVTIRPSMDFFKGVTILPYDSCSDDYRALRAPYLWTAAARHLAVYEAMRRRPYDRVFIVRPDLFFDRDIDLTVDLPGDTLMGDSKVHPWDNIDLKDQMFVQDQYFLMNRPLLNQMVHFEAFWRRTGQYEIHNGLAKFFIANRWNVVTHPAAPRITIVRQNSRGYQWADRDEANHKVRRDSEVWTEMKARDRASRGLPP